MPNLAGPFDYELATRKPMTSFDVARFLVRESSDISYGFSQGCSPSIRGGPLEYFVIVGTADWGHSSGYTKYYVVVIGGVSPYSRGQLFGIRVNKDFPSGQGSFDRSKLDEAVKKAIEELGIH